MRKPTSTATLLQSQEKQQQEQEQRQKEQEHQQQQLPPMTTPRDILKRLKHQLEDKESAFLSLSTDIVLLKSEMVRLGVKLESKVQELASVKEDIESLQSSIENISGRKIKGRGKRVVEVDA